MNIRFLSAVAFGLALTAAAYSQDAPTDPSAGQTPAQGRGPGGGQGQRGGRGGGMGMGAGMMGRGLTGTVTEVAADHYTIKTDAGDIYTIHFSANTRIMKQMAGMRERGESGQGMGAGAGGNPPQQIKATDIKVGDAIAAMGE
jgi:hypothetical protein